MRKSFVMLALMLAIAALSPSAASPQDAAPETYFIRPTYLAGQKLAVSATSVATTTLYDALNPKFKLGGTQTTEKAFNMEILEVRDGYPSKLKVSFSEQRVISNAKGKEKQEVPGELKGKTVVASMDKDRKLTVEADFAITDGGRKELQGFFDSAFLYGSFPIAPVPVGHKFNISKEAISVILNAATEMDDFKAEFTFEKIEEHNGKKCAAIAIDISFESAQKDASGTFEGKGYVWVSLEDAIAYGMEAKFTLNGTQNVKEPKTGKPIQLVSESASEQKQVVTLE